MQCVALVVCCLLLCWVVVPPHTHTHSLSLSLSRCGVCIYITNVRRSGRESARRGGNTTRKPHGGGRAKKDAVKKQHEEVLLSCVAHLVDTKIEESYYKSQHTGSFSKRRKKRARCADSYELLSGAWRSDISTTYSASFSYGAECRDLITTIFSFFSLPSQKQGCGIGPIPSFGPLIPQSKFGLTLKELVESYQKIYQSDIK